MIKAKPRSSVVIVVPTIGERLDLLEQTLGSLSSQRPQAPDIVLVCPTKKHIVDLAKQFGAETVKDPGTGLSGALNAGFEHAKPWHKYGGWLGDDDILRPGAVAAGLAALERTDGAVLAYGYCDYIDKRNRILFTNKTGNLAPMIMSWGPNLIPLMGILYDLKIAKEVGGYDESLKYSMDLDMWLRLKRRGKFVNTKKVLGAFRWHDTSTTVANRTTSLKEAAMVKRRYLPTSIRVFAPLWEVPVAWATYFAVRRVNAKVHSLAR